MGGCFDRENESVTELVSEIVRWPGSGTKLTVSQPTSESNDKRTCRTKSNRHERKNI